LLWPPDALAFCREILYLKNETRTLAAGPSAILGRGKGVDKQCAVRAGGLDSR
jgi:hypothetical protein